MTVFTASFSGVAVSAAQDLFEIVAPADSRIRLLEIDIGQYSDFGDAQAEIVAISVHRGHTVSGSGGTSITAGATDSAYGLININPYGRASGATVEVNNTTVATTTGELLWATGWHIQAGFLWRPDESAPRGLPPFRRHILIKPSQRLVIRITAPADALTTNGSILFEEIGKSPVS